MTCNLAALVPAACLLLAACATPTKRIGQDDPYLGEAVKYNAAFHTIDPDPVYPEDGAQPGDNGDRAAAAVERYRSGQAKAQHKSEAAQSSTTGGTSSSGGGGGPQ